MKWCDTTANVEIMARYLDAKNYGLLDLALMLRSPHLAEPTFRQALKWWQHEQELQQKFNENAERILRS